MKQWVYKIKQSLKILKALVRYSFITESAYAANNWGNILSTTAYVITLILFIKIILQKFHSIAGYSENEILILFFSGQLYFYASWGSGVRMIGFELVEAVRNGNFDYYLIRPWNVLIALLGTRLRTFALLRDAIVPTAILSLWINWGAVHIHSVTQLLFFIFPIIALIIEFAISITLSSIVFFLGEATRVLDVFVRANSDNTLSQMPLDALPTGSKRYLLLSILPALLTSAVGGAVFLGKLPLMHGLIIALPIVCVALVIMTIVWKLGLKHYASASS